MSSVNPYQAPQTITTAEFAGSDVPFELGPEFLVVSKGARYCYAAVVTFLLSVIVFVVLSLLLGMLAWLFALALPVILLLCAVLHLIGMLMMSRVDPASRAPGLLTTAAVLFGIGFFISVALFVLQVTNSIDDTSALLKLLQAVISCASNVLLMIALKRIGQYVQHPPITNKANGALWGLILMYVVLITYIVLATLAALGYAPFLAKRDTLGSMTLIMGISIFVLAIYALISYSSAVSLIGKLHQIKLAYKNSYQLPVQLPGNLSLPTPGQEMDFMK